MKSQSCGADEVSLKVIKATKTIVTPILTHLINLSLEEGTFPERLKLARVLPLHKGKSKNEPINYRPISILPFFSKIYEKVVHKRMYDYLQEQNLLCDTQFCFRKGLSTDLAILKLVDWVNDVFDKGLIPAALLLNIKKGFDTVDHDKLLQIVESFGVRNVALKWFRLYLINRAQVVQMQMQHQSAIFYRVECNKVQ